MICRVTDKPDGRFDVLVSMPTGRFFRRTGFLTRAEADAGIEELRLIVAAIGKTLQAA